MRDQGRKERARAIGANIRRMRLAAGLSQVALARAVGVSQPTVVFWESGSDVPGSLLVQLAAALGVEVEEVVRVPEPPRPKRGG